MNVHISLYFALTLHLLSHHLHHTTANIGRIHRANNPTGEGANNRSNLKPAVTPSPPHDSRRTEYDDCDWIDPSDIVPKSLSTKHYTVTPSQLHHYNLHGHVTLRVLGIRDLTHRIPTYHPAHPRIKFAIALRTCAQHIFDSNAIWGAPPSSSSHQHQPSFHRIHNLFQKTPLISNLVTSPRISKIVADLLNVDRIRLYQDSLFWKDANHNSSRWHQDMVAAPFQDDTKMVTMWMPLDSFADDHMGALRFAQSSHIQGRITEFDSNYHGTISDNDVRASYKVVGAGYGDAKHRIKRGSASFHDGFTVHGSGPNFSTKERVALAVQFVDADAKLMSWKEFHDAKQKHTRANDDSAFFEEWMRAKELVDGKGSDGVTRELDHPYFPIVFDRNDATAPTRARENVRRFKKARWVWSNRERESKTCKDDAQWRNMHNDGCSVYAKDGPAHEYCTKDASLAYIHCAKSCAVLCEGERERVVSGGGSGGEL